MKKNYLTITLWCIFEKKSIYTPFSTFFSFQIKFIDVNAVFFSLNLNLNISGIISLETQNWKSLFAEETMTALMREFRVGYFLNTMINILAYKQWSGFILLERGQQEEYYIYW